MSVELLSTLLRLYPFFFHAHAPTEIYTLSLHDALPISEDYIAISHVWADGIGGATERGLNTCQAKRLSRLCNSIDRKSTRLNSSHITTSYAVFCLKKKNERTSVVPRSKSRISSRSFFFS